MGQGTGKVICQDLTPILYDPYIVLHTILGKTALQNMHVICMFKV